MLRPERTIRPTLQDGDIAVTHASVSLPRLDASIQPLVAPAAAVWLSYVAFAVLLQSPAFRIYDAGLLPYARVLRGAAVALGPDALLSATRTSTEASWLMPVSLAVLCAILSSWCWALRVAHSADAPRLRVLLILSALIATPLLLSAGLFSDDVYLYNSYGRMIAVHGANPILTLPSAFPADPHLPWVYWKELPSSYGPVWLMLSGLLSAAAGDSLTGVVISYRLAAIAAHLATAAALWSILRRSRPREALAGTVFYAWNPLVLVEVVGNAHNDVLVALFAILLVGAAMQRASIPAALFAAGAIMVKPFAFLLLVPLAAGIARQAGVRALATPAAVCASAIAFVSLPFWSGTTFVSNVINNPAAHMYTNTIWELLSEAGRWFGVQTTSIQHPYFDWIRAVVFSAVALWIFSRRSSWRRPWRAGLKLWLLFYLTASWVWPWYFVPAIALAPLAGRYAIVTTTALTVGGLLFWRAWPAPTPAPLEWLFTWRSLLLFGPLLLTMMSARTRAVVLRTLGLHRRGAPADEVSLPTAA